MTIIAHSAHTVDIVCPTCETDPQHQHQVLLYCPKCHTTSCVPWQRTVNALLDHVLNIQDAVSDLKKAIEEAVL